MQNIIVECRATAARIFAAVALANAGVASATTLQVSPINLFVIAPGKAGAVSLANQSKVPVRLQIRIFRWRQLDGKEMLEPTRDVIANPPSMEIPAEQTYTVRIARIAPAPVGAEESYRLIIDELPSPIDQAAPSNGVRMLLRTSLPVFFNTKGAAPKIAWRLWTANGTLNLEAANSGDRHIKLVGLMVEGQQGKTKFNAAGANAYVLPGSTLRYAAMPGTVSYAPGSAVTITTAKGTPFEVRQQVTVMGTP
jgi:fimbrial chaperone protein